MSINIELLLSRESVESPLQHLFSFPSVENLIKSPNYRGSSGFILSFGPTFSLSESLDYVWWGIEIAVQHQVFLHFLVLAVQTCQFI